MEKEKQIKRLNSLLRVLKDLNRAEDFDEFLEDNDIELQEIFWSCEYFLSEYKEKLEKE